jgi:hypothetical protein
MPNPAVARCMQFAPDMMAQRTKNVLKIAGSLLMLGLFLAAMLLGPELRQITAPSDAMRLPAMSNVPPPGSLQVEVESAEAQPGDVEGSQ